MAQYKGPASESQRVMHLQKKREREQEEIELKKRKLADELKVSKMESKFSAHYDAVENDLKSSTVGLLTVEELKTRQENAVKEREMQLARKNREEERKQKKEEKAKEKARKKQNQQIKALSFNTNEDDEEEEEEDETEEESTTESLSKKRFGKCPTVDTSFLPDVERDEEENVLREQLRLEWETRQATLKAEEIGVTYSYWDGSGHRRSLTMKKGNSIYQFLQKALEDLRPDFPELRSVTADQLMYVKEDLILPQTNTFYDFIVTKARGKSGPLFSFDVQEDIRLVSDGTERQETHAGKVVLRGWYERNKHIFPASRWEPYDPTRTYDKYTFNDRSKK